jgi:hypothetical protein
VAFGTDERECSGALSAEFHSRWILEATLQAAHRDLFLRAKLIIAIRPVYLVTFSYSLQRRRGVELDIKILSRIQLLLFSDFPIPAFARSCASLATPESSQGGVPVPIH